MPSEISRPGQEEAIADVIANSFVAFVRLVERDKIELAYPTVLARYGIAQHKCGRRVGTRLNVKNVSSDYCRVNKSVFVQRLDRFDDDEGVWKEILLEDRTAGPAEIAACRMDFSGWLKTLTAAIGSWPSRWPPAKAPARCRSCSVCPRVGSAGFAENSWTRGESSLARSPYRGRSPRRKDRPR